MNHHGGRLLLSAFVVVVFGVMAVGSAEKKEDPQEAGKAEAVDWAADSYKPMGKKIRTVRKNLDHARGEVTRLQDLTEKFPTDASRFADDLGRWTAVVGSLEGAVAVLEKEASTAYVTFQSQGGDPGDLVKQVYEVWKPIVSEALDVAEEAKKQTKGGK